MKSKFGEVFGLHGKTIDMFLLNKTMDGIVSAEMGNWNGTAIKTPRNGLSLCGKELEEIMGAGVYFLFCEDDESGGESVYIGEAENVYKRLDAHVKAFNGGKEKFYWHTAVAFLGKDLNKANIRFMENHLVQLARGFGHKVLTKNTHEHVVLKKGQKATALEFIENVKILLGVMGHSVLRDVGHVESSTVYLFCKGKDANAKGFVSANGFVVLKGSSVSTHVTPSLIQHKSYAELRERLERSGIIKDGVLQKDYEFRSPSAAASVVKGSPANGNDVWKTEAGIHLGAL